MRDHGSAEKEADAEFRRLPWHRFENLGDASTEDLTANTHLHVIAYRVRFGTDQAEGLELDAHALDVLDCL